MKEEQQQCIHELSRYDISKFENDKLTARLRKLAHEHYKENLEKTIEIENRRKQAFETKMSMDHLFRSTLSEFDADYKLRAVRKRCLNTIAIVIHV